MPKTKQTGVPCSCKKENKKLKCRTLIETNILGNPNTETKSIEYPDIESTQKTKHENSPSGGRKWKKEEELLYNKPFTDRELKTAIKQQKIQHLEKILLIPR